MMLHFAAGKGQDDLGDYAGAIRHFDAANRIRRRVAPFDRSRFERRVDSLIARFGRELLRLERGAGAGRRDAGPGPRHAAFGDDPDRAHRLEPSAGGGRRGAGLLGAVRARVDRRRPDAPRGGGRSAAWRLPPPAARHRPGRPAGDRQDAVQLPLDRARSPPAPERPDHPLPAKPARHLPVDLLDLLLEGLGVRERSEAISSGITASTSV